MARSGTSIVVAAWGNHGGPRGFEAIKFLAPSGLSYFKLNKDGSPQHPLYMPYSQKLSQFGKDLDVKS
jgi:hypothetical protein